MGSVPIFNSPSLTKTYPGPPCVKNGKYGDGSLFSLPRFPVLPPLSRGSLRDKSPSSPFKGEIRRGDGLTSFKDGVRPIPTPALPLKGRGIGDFWGDSPYFFPGQVPHVGDGLMCRKARPGASSVYPNFAMR